MRLNALCCNVLFTCLFLGLCSVSKSSAAQGDNPAADGFYIPTTVSKAAQNALRQFSRKDRDALLVPASDDKKGWHIAYVQSEQVIDNTALLSSYKPLIRKISLAGVPALDIRPQGYTDNGKVVIYLHGGAYTFNSANSSLVSSVPLADASGLRVLAIDYTPAPAADWRIITDQVVNAYKAVLAMGFTPADVAFYGESAGGGLVGGSILKARDMGLPLPAAALFWSPWADITETGDTYHTLKDNEPTYTYSGFLGRSAAAYADPADQKNPYVSPVYGDFSKGFPSSMIQVGTKELFLSNGVRLYQVLDQSGISVKLDVYEGMVHVFQVTMAATPEAEIALRKSANFLRRELGLFR